MPLRMPGHRLSQPSSSRLTQSILSRTKRTPPASPKQYATVASTVTSIPQPDHIQPISAPIRLYPSTQPPSHKPAQFRKTQLLRQYASLLSSTPLTLLFQHNNLKAVEWVGIRRELRKAMEKVDMADGKKESPELPIASAIKLQIIQTGLLSAALNVVEFYKPVHAEGELTHVLSRAAHSAAIRKTNQHPLTPLLSGPVMLVTFPRVSPEHLGAVLSILSPSSPDYKAPSRKASPTYYDDSVQGGLQKLMFLGARVDGKVFDLEGTKWVGKIPNITALRAQLVQLLESVGAGVTNTLESASRSLYFTMEGRRTMLEDEAKPKEEAKS